MKIMTSESVFRGHPDKVCDQISDAVLDACLEQDGKSRVAIECLVKDGNLIVAGELTTKAQIDIEEIAKGVLGDIGYEPDGFKVTQMVSKQSPDIALGVDRDGAGDQGIMFGYACDETESLMPLPIVLSRDIAIAMDEETRKRPDIFGRDGKCQVSVGYKGYKAAAITTIVVSQQTKPGVDRSVYQPIIERVIKDAMPSELMGQEQILINPTGEFVVGGPWADSGLTGRKIICDTYGGLGRHGGGAFSGKDPTKVDRSAAYYARYVAKNIVAAGLAHRCEVQVAYAIGVADPVSIYVDTFGTGRFPDWALREAIAKLFNFSPRAIRAEILSGFKGYRRLAEYGHIGRADVELPWEKTNKAYVLKAYFRKKHF